MRDFREWLEAAASGKIRAGAGPKACCPHQGGQYTIQEVVPGHSTTPQRFIPRPSSQASMMLLVMRTFTVVVVLLSVGHVSAADALPIPALQTYLSDESADRAKLGEQAFATASLSREQAKEAAEILWKDHVARIRQQRAAEMKAKQIKLGDKVMRFEYKRFGKKPESGRSLYISMHGGGGAPSRVNDQQWENQKRLYQLKEGIYLVPRAPTDTWNLWHQAHVDPMFTRLIENLIVLEDVNPDRVYIMGYSAGGDGVYQLAPRMADQLAAASMMAGHPNETSPLGLRNIGFTLHMGEKDAAYNRNQTAANWKEMLAKLQKEDPQGYRHHVQIHPGKGHWMGLQDAVAIDWMAKFTRDLRPQQIVWKQDDVQHRRFYWLALGQGDVKGRALVRATRKGDRITIDSNDVERLLVRLDDAMVDLDQPVQVVAGEKTVFGGKVPRTIATLAKTLAERGDPRGMFSAEVEVTLK